MSTALRPWITGFSDGDAHEFPGGRVDVRWADGFTSAHDLVTVKKELGFYLTHHGTQVWVPLKLVQFRKIPLAKKFMRDAMKKRDR